MSSYFPGQSLPLICQTSKKSKIQSHSLAAPILEGLMPITTEEEPEDIDDDAPARVCAFNLVLYE